MSSSTIVACFGSKALGDYSVAYTALTVAGLISIILSCVWVIQCVSEVAHGSNRKVGRTS